MIRVVVLAAKPVRGVPDVIDWLQIVVSLISIPTSGLLAWARFGAVEAVIAMLAVFGLLLFWAAYRLLAEQDLRERVHPKLELVELASTARAHRRRLRIWDEQDETTWEGFYLTATFVNRPLTRSRDSDATQVNARVTMYDGTVSRRSPQFMGRWKNANDAWEDAPVPDDKLSVDFPSNETSRDLVLAVKHQDDEDAYICTGESFSKQYPDGRLRGPSSIPPGAFYFRVWLVGHRVDQVFWLKCSNEGKGEGFRATHTAPPAARL